jgi:serine/threonine protein kinase
MFLGVGGLCGLSSRCPSVAIRAPGRPGAPYIKVSNTPLDEDDFAYLIDFGIAHGADETGSTGTGAMIGSWHYMAPERLRASEADAPVDIYALACVLYECLTGSRPFPGDSVESQVSAHLTDPPPQPSTAQPNVPAQFDAVIAKGMAKDPDNRYATTVELVDAARNAITVPITRPTPTPTQPPTEPAPVPATHQASGIRRGATIALILGGLAIIALAVGITLVEQRQSESSREGWRCDGFGFAREYVPPGGPRRSRRRGRIARRQIAGRHLVGVHRRVCVIPAVVR